jgi:hypothetical protein
MRPCMTFTRDDEGITRVKRKQNLLYWVMWYEGPIREVRWHGAGFSDLLHVAGFNRVGESMR